MRRAIARKRDGDELDAATWRGVVRAFLTGVIDDAQVAALLMASVVRGMTPGETYALTAAFLESGETLQARDPRTVDKHSSGGVGDSVSLIVVPLVAACGVPVAKLSGRALGHTGGTLNKLEAIPGVTTALTPERFFACVERTGCAIGAQNERLVPADRRFYALRDRTATVPSRGLIAASIVSKKIAGGAHAIVFDVKVGNGAFVPDVAQGRALAETLVALARAFGRRARAIVTDMHEPLGPAIGTGLEAREAREYLGGVRRDARLTAVCDALGRAMLELAGYSGDAGDALATALESGRAYETFERMLAYEGAVAGALESLAAHAVREPVYARRSGYVVAMDTTALGEIARELVTRHGDAAGIVLARRGGDRVHAGDLLATLFGDAAQVREVTAAFVIGDRSPEQRPLVYCEIDTLTVAADAGSSMAGAMRSAGADAPSTLEIK